MSSEKADSLRGYYEASQKDFDVKVKSSKGGATVVWDLKQAVPDLFLGTNQISRTLHQIWRKVIDEVIKDAEGGAYYSDGSSQVMVFFEKINEVGGKAKLERASAEVKRAVKARIEGGPGAEAQKDQAGAEKKRVGGDSALSTVIAEGLKENASFKEVGFWADRVLREIQIGGARDAMPQDLVKNAMNVKCVFYPLWNAAGQAIAGNFVTAGTIKGMKGETVGIRTDLALLSWACLELLRLVKSNVQTLVILPLSINSFGEDVIFDLYINVLRRMNPAIYKLLVFEVRDLPSGTLSPKIKDQLASLSRLSRATIVNSGILSFPDYASPDFQPHAYGFDLAEFNLPASDVYGKIFHYGDIYKKRNAKTFIKGVANAEAAKTAEGAGFLYIAGPALAQPLPKCVGVKKISFDDLLKAQG